MSRTKNLVCLGALSLAAVLIAACVPSPAAPPPTVMLLPSLTPTTLLAEVPTEVVSVPTATERSIERWFAVGAELVPVYDCADLGCGIIATFDEGEAVDVYNTVDLWHEIRLPDGSSAYMLYGTISQAEQTAEPTATGSITARPTRTLIPSRTASSTMTATATPTATATTTATATITPTATSTGTRTNTPTPFPTLPLAGPSQGGQRPGLPAGTIDEPGFNPTNTVPAPGTPGYIPPTLTWTPSRTLLPTATSTLAVPPGGGSPPPTVIIIATVTSQPGGNTPPPGAGTVVPTSNFPPPGSTSPPGSGNPVPTSNFPPPPPPPPPGA